MRYARSHPVTYCTNILTGNQCKPCQEGALPTIYDRAVTHSTDDSTACEVLILNSRAGAKPQRITASSSARTPTALSSAQILATHLLDRLTRPRQLLILTLQTSWTSPTRSLTRSASLKDGMIIVMTKIDADGKLEGNCTWVCSGKVSCQLHCCDSTTEAQCSLIEDGGVLPEGQATEAAGKCEIIKKNKVAEIMVCHIPEAAGDALTAGWGQDPMGVHCQIFWTGTMSQLICNYVG